MSKEIYENFIKQTVTHFFTLTITLIYTYVAILISVLLRPSCVCMTCPAKTFWTDSNASQQIHAIQFIQILPFVW